MKLTPLSSRMNDILNDNSLIEEVEDKKEGLVQIKSYVSVSPRNDT